MQVLQILRGDEESLKLIKERQKSKLQRTYSVELFDAEEYNSTKYLNESQRDRHMETILSSSNSIKEESNKKPDYGLWFSDNVLIHGTYWSWN